MPDDRTTTTIAISIDEFTLGEIEELEELTGMTLRALMRRMQSDDGAPTKAVSALAWIARRRAEPELTLDDVRALRLSEIEFAGAAEADEPAEDPTPPPADGEAYAPA